MKQQYAHQVLDTTASSIQYSLSDIFLNIWFRPLQVFRFIQQQKFETGLFAISTFVGMYITLRLIPLTGYLLSRESMVISLFMFSVFIGGLIGIVAPFILASGLAQFGDWLGGKAGGRSILRILVYSLLPLIMAFAILLIKLAFLKEAYLFPDAVEQLNEGTLLFLSILDKIEYVLWTWSFVLLVFGLAYVQDFHFLIAIFNLLFLVFGPFLFFRLIIEGFSSSWRKPRK